MHANRREWKRDIFLSALLVGLCGGLLMTGAELPEAKPAHGGHGAVGRDAVHRFAWSPAQGFLFVDGSCGTDDLTLGWMGSAAPQGLREARLIMFRQATNWVWHFQEASKHFIARWSALKGREVVVVPGDHGRLKDDPITVRVPTVTPFGVGTLEEAMYLQGYCGGYMDFMNQRQATGSPVSGARGRGWDAGWAAARAAGS